VSFTTVENFEPIELKPIEVENACRLARLRQEAKEKSGAKHRVDWVEAGFGSHWLGLMGEMAVGRYLGFNVDRRILPGGDDSIDLQDSNATIQVKTRAINLRTMPLHKLEMIFPPDTTFAADYFVLCRMVNITTIELIGWQSREIVACQCIHREKAFNRETGACVFPAHRLYAMRYLKKELAERPASRDSHCA